MAATTTRAFGLRAVLLVVVLLAAACGAVAPTPPAPATEAAPSVGSPRGGRVAGGATGAVTVAYPDDPVGMLDLDGDDPAARDLLALWGLPLFELDAAGQLEPGLVDAWRVVPSTGDAAWTVEVDLAPGTWSDGREVSAADVVATVDALRETGRAAELTPLLAATVESPATVRLAFDRPYARWADLLDGVGVLPAHVLATDGLDAFADEVPVAGGRFVLAQRDRGRSLTFRVHDGSALSAPGVDTVEVLVVPRYEASLGLLESGGAQVSMGYVALNGAGRARQVAGTLASAPTGGTWVALEWRRGARGLPDAPMRRSVRDAIDVGELVDGLLDEDAEILAVPLPRQVGPGGPRPQVSEVPDLTIVTPKWQEALAFTGRSVQRDLRIREADVSMVAEGTPRFVTEARRTGHAALRIMRTGPRPTFTRWVGEEQRDSALVADASGVGGSALDAGLGAVDEAALIAPLYRPTVTHAWADGLDGFVPSAWPGLAFTSIPGWRLAAG